MRLILFDIDGTLIDTHGAGGSALREAFRVTFDIAELGTVPFSGRTDRGIIQNLLQLHGIERTSENWQRLCDLYLQTLPTYLQKRQGRVLAGVSEILESLSQQDALRGLLTGNLRAGARLKLRHFGLDHHFAFGGFGDHFLDRDEVARAALAAAREVQPHEFNGDVWVVGDTPLDIRCARAIDARILAVATGVHPRCELAELKPDLLLDDLSDINLVLDTLLS